MSKVDDIKADLGVEPVPADLEWLNICVHASPKVGKTMFAATADDVPEMRPVLFLDIEGGLLTIRHKAGVIDRKRLRSMQELSDFVNKLYLLPDKPWKTLVLDNVTELQKLDIKEIMKLTKANARNPDKVDVDVPSQREYLKTGGHIREVIRALRDMPMHVIITAWTRHENVGSDDAPKYKAFPYLTGQVKGELAGYMDIVGYYYTRSEGAGAARQVVRRMQFVETDGVVAGDRTTVLGDYIDNPTMPILWDIINNPNGNPTERSKSNESDS